MDAIFGKIKPPELFSSRNGMGICSIIEQYFHSGVLAVVPLLPERPNHALLSRWIGAEVRGPKFAF
jgi:hypothetical protein